MENLFTASFEANNPDRNHHRRYQIAVGRDLFGAWTLTISHGRIGQTGRQFRFAADSKEPLRSIVKKRLQRREGAPRRIGCAYELTELNHVPDFDAREWLPGQSEQDQAGWQA